MKFLIFVVIVILALQCKAQEVKVMLSNVTVLVGHEAVIPCEYDAGGATETPTLRWSAVAKDQSRQRLYTFKKGDETVTRDVALATRQVSINDMGSLVVKNTTLEDNDIIGTLICEVDFGQSGSFEDSLKFEIVSQADQPPFVQLEESDFQAGQETTIGTCMSGYGYPEPVITFYRGMEEIDSYAGTELLKKEVNDAVLGAFLEDTISTDKGHTTSVKRTLVKTLTKEDDEAVFSCVVTSGGMTDETMLVQNTTFKSFRVKYPTDEVNIKSSPELAFLDTTVKLECMANGYPNPRITFDDQNTNILDIKVTIEETGREVVCAAQYQSLAEKTDSHRIVVLYSEVPVITKNPVSRGDTLTLLCESKANPPSRLMWFRNGEELSSENESSDEISITTRSKLTIPKVEFSHSGKYVCKAMNEHERLNKEAETNVKVQGVKLVSAKESVDVEGILNDVVDLECIFSSQPKPTITWSKESGEMTEDLGTKPVTKVPGTNEYKSTFQVGPLDPKMSNDVYVCKAANGKGANAMKRFKVPEIEEEPSTEVIVQESSSAGIIIGILVALLVVAIIIAVLYKKGIICKKEEKGEENAGDIAVELADKDKAAPVEKAETDLEAGQTLEETTPTEQDKLVNGADQ